MDQVEAVRPLRRRNTWVSSRWQGEVWMAMAMDRGSVSLSSWSAQDEDNWLNLAKQEGECSACSRDASHRKPSRQTEATSAWQPPPPQWENDFNKWVLLSLPFFHLTGKHAKKRKTPEKDPVTHAKHERSHAELNDKQTKKKNTIKKQG